MGYGSNVNKQNYSEVFTPQQVKAVVQGFGVNLSSETDTVFMCYCPFHSNTRTPSFAINKFNGTAICFNESCNYRGNLITLSRHLTKRTLPETLRYIEKKGGETQHEAVEALLNQKPFEFTKWDTNKLTELQQNFWAYQPAIDYMHGRGFNDETLKYFGVGYGPLNNMIAVPMYDPKGMLVGVVGRGLESKEFKNSHGLPRKETLFNLHNAKRFGSIVIVTESAFDVMSNYQAGFPNTVGTLGGNLSDHNYRWLDKYFDTIIIMTDNDELRFEEKCKKCPGDCQGHNDGRALGYSIVEALTHKNIMWATYSKDEIYPEGKKDSTDMTIEQRRQCINNAMTHFEYVIRFET